LDLFNNPVGHLKARGSLASPVISRQQPKFLNNSIEPVPKLIDCALTRTILGQALAVFQVFILAKLRSLRLLSQNFSFGKASIVF
jgi:hypothetical protein